MSSTPLFSTYRQGEHRITHGRAPLPGSERLATCVTLLLASIPLLIDASPVGVSWPVLTMGFSEKL